MVLATVRASSAIEGPFVPRGHVRLAKACVGYRRSIEYLAWIENAFRVQHPLDIQHQRPLLRVARDWEPCLLLQTDAMFGRDRTANPAQWLIDAAFNLFPVFGAARTNGDGQIAVAHMSKERKAPFMPAKIGRASCRERGGRPCISRWLPSY